MEDTRRFKEVQDIKDYFHSVSPKNLFSASILVDSKLMKEWVLAYETMIIDGKVLSVAFRKVGGGIYRGTIYNAFIREN